MDYKARSSSCPSALCGYQVLEHIATDVLGKIYKTQTIDEVNPLVRIVESTTNASNATTSVWPVRTEIIISDPPCPADLDERNMRTFPVCINGNLQWVRLAPHVRKPGYWAATAIRVSAAQLSKEKEAVRERRILDLGCGSGVIGTFLAKQLNTRVVFSDIDKTAVRCACEYAESQGIENPDGRVGDMFAPLQTNDKFDLVVFGAPFFPQLEGADLPDTDIGGKRGNELAARFIQEVGAFLAPGGHAVTYLPDFVEDAPLIQSVAEAHLKFTKREEKFILYPFETKYGFPQSHEIRYRRGIEATCGYRFQEENWDDRRFLRFKMVYFVLSKPPASIGD